MRPIAVTHRGKRSRSVNKLALARTITREGQASAWASVSNRRWLLMLPHPG
jgi:hypothetical protein